MPNRHVSAKVAAARYEDELAPDHRREEWDEHGDAVLRELKTGF